MLHIKTKFSLVFFLPISLKSIQCNNQEQTRVLEHSLANNTFESGVNNIQTQAFVSARSSVNLSCVVDMFLVLHELALVHACTLLKLASSVHATLKPKGQHPKRLLSSRTCVDFKISLFFFQKYLLNKHMGLNNLDEKSIFS